MTKCGTRHTKVGTYLELPYYSSLVLVAAPKSTHNAAVWISLEERHHSGHDHERLASIVGR